MWLWSKIHQCWNCSSTPVRTREPPTSYFSPCSYHTHTGRYTQTDTHRYTTEQVRVRSHFHTCTAGNKFLFSLSIRQGVVGQQARDALLLIMSLSASDPRVAQHIAENTYFCPVSTKILLPNTNRLIKVMSRADKRLSQ